MRYAQKKALAGLVLTLLAALAAVCLVAAVVHVAKNPLPVVAVDHIDRTCVWVELAPEFERRECPAELPRRYEQVFVKVVK